ncbi:DUF202 domain-containing protein [Mycolicibacterium iranicum]|uniref:DUF202 domain-containing protein n=1 Tax=Mycolicibacterium iranicum TaxID=912594 RepID=A0A178M1A6_MYCIR|nr:DUF202 domain-containing protein [Mycolicibacterium iranicum]OAN41759.1 hypothetical protein A4X20_02550 [Mycolicibacterium iranicum]
MKPGLQVERTQLSWERSAFGIVVGGALILLRPHGPLEVGRVALASFAGLLALVVLWLAYRRSRRMREAQSRVPPPRVEVLILGYGTALFALAIVIALLVVL